MNKKGKYERERFTDEEVDIISKVAQVVCFVFDTTVEELRSHSRSKPLPDARKVLSHYISINIRLQNIHSYYSVALSTWYLNRDHSSICYYVKSAEDLYQTDKNFKVMYDNVIEIIKNPENFKMIVLDEEKKPLVGLSWESIRMSMGYSNAVKLATMPQKVYERISDMYKVGYSLNQIAHQVRTTSEFIKYVVGTNNLTREFTRSNIVKSSFNSIRVSSKDYSTKVDY